MPVKCACGRQTNNQDGTCTVCTLFNKDMQANNIPLRGTDRKCMDDEEEEDGMTIPAREKVCVDCHEPYQPRSNAQSRCDGCATKHKETLKQRPKVKAKGNGKAPKKEPTPTIHVPKEVGILAQLIAQRDKLNIAIEVIQGL